MSDDSKPEMKINVPRETPTITKHTLGDADKISVVAVCGCAMQAEVSSDGKTWQKACASHGETKEWEVSLYCREAMCSMCAKLAPSDTGLAFFRYQPNMAVDHYYCGCFGFD